MMKNLCAEFLEMFNWSLSYMILLNNVLKEEEWITCPYNFSLLFMIEVSVTIS